MQKWTTTNENIFSTYYYTTSIHNIRTSKPQSKDKFVFKNAIIPRIQRRLKLTNAISVHMILCMVQKHDGYLAGPVLAGLIQGAKAMTSQHMAASLAIVQYKYKCQTKNHEITQS